MPNSDLTVAQAQDLANYFLGPGWIARERLDTRKGFPDWCELVPVIHARAAFAPLFASHLGKKWRQCFSKAGVPFPPAAKAFAHRDKTVYKGADSVCLAVSSNMAQRIANALNHYTPDSRGK